MDKALDLIVITAVIAYWLAMAIVFFKAARHFYGWFINSTPPMGKLGPLVESFTMFFPRYLTKEGLEERNNFFKWFAVTLVMGGVFIVAVELAKNHAT